VKQTGRCAKDGRASPAERQTRAPRTRAQARPAALPVPRRTLRRGGKSVAGFWGTSFSYASLRANRLCRAKKPIAPQPTCQRLPQENAARYRRRAQSRGLFTQSAPADGTHGHVSVGQSVFAGRANEFDCHAAAPDDQPQPDQDERNEPKSAHHVDDADAFDKATSPDKLAFLLNWLHENFGVWRYSRGNQGRHDRRFDICRPEEDLLGAMRAGSILASGVGRKFK